MMRSYGLLLATVLALGLFLIWAGHGRHSAPARERVASTHVAERIEITVKDASVDPASVVVPKNARVHLTIRNAGAHSKRISLAGYEDRLAALSLQPGETAEREFTADLPGEDFAWLVNGEPVGRFQVSGSHLVEGHR